MAEVGKTWREKLSMIEDLIPFVIQDAQVRHKIEADTNFLLSFLPKFFRGHRALTLRNLAAGVLHATIHNANIEEAEKYSSDFASTWIFSHESLYECFAGTFLRCPSLPGNYEAILRHNAFENYNLHRMDYFCEFFRCTNESDGLTKKTATKCQKIGLLRQINEDFEQIAYIDPKASQQLVDTAVPQFGPVATYIFAVLMSVLLDDGVFERLRDEALAHAIRFPPNLDLVQEDPADNDRARLSRSDGSAIRKPRITPPVTPQKRSSSNHHDDMDEVPMDNAGFLSPVTLAIGSFPPRSDPGLHGKAITRRAEALTEDIINRRHSSQLTYGPNGPMPKSPSATSLRSSSASIRSSSASIAILSSSASHSASHSDDSDEDDRVIHQQTAPEGGAIGLARDRLRYLRLQHRGSDRTGELAMTDSYANYLKPQHLEGYLLKQTRNPRRDTKYKDKVWKKRWVMVGDDAFFYYKDTEDDEPITPQGIVPLYLITGVRTASRFGAHSFEIDAGGRSFYFKAETEEEMRKWLFAFQCAVARNLDKVLMAETRRRQKLMSSLKKWWKQFIDWESVISGADQGADEEDCPPSPSRAGEVSSNADLRLNVVTCDRQGARAYMEDQSFVVTNTAAKFKTANCYACLGVFDGHGGAEAAQYCKDKMASKLFQAPLTMDTISETITKAFQEIDAEFFDIAEQADDCSGTTATIVIISTNQLIVANVGDSRAVLCRGGNAIALTEDHRPSNPSEYKRIKDAGGTIEENRELNLARLYQINPELLGASQIPQRLADMVGFVTDYRILGCLAVSRALGDFEMKTGYWDAKDGDQWEEDLVSCIPSIMKVDRDSTDEFIVIASDGIWDVMENKVVVDYIRDAVRRGLAPKILAENLITKAISLGSQDNITVTIAFLQYVAQPPSLRTSRKA